MKYLLILPLISLAACGALNEPREQRRIAYISQCVNNARIVMTQTKTTLYADSVTDNCRDQAFYVQ